VSEPQLEWIQSCLDSRDPNVIRSGILLVSYYKLTEAGTKIAPLLFHKAWQVGKAAAETLGELEFKPAEPHLVRIVSRGDEANLRRNILACASMKDDAEDGDKKGGARGGQDDVAWQVKKAAALALNRINPHIVEDVLLASLDTDNRQMLIAGMGGLAQLGSTRSATRFLPFLAHTDREIRKTAVVCLGVLTCDDAAKGIMDLMEESDPALRREAIIALNHIKDIRAVPLFIRALKDANSDVRTVAAVALGNTLHPAPEIVVALRGALEDPAAQVKGAACSALANLKVAEAVDWMTPLLSQGGEETQRKIAWAIQELVLRAKQKRYEFPQ